MAFKRVFPVYMHPFWLWRISVLNKSVLICRRRRSGRSEFLLHFAFVVSNLFFAGCSKGHGVTCYSSARVFCDVSNYGWAIGFFPHNFVKMVVLWFFRHRHRNNYNSNILPFVKIKVHNIAWPDHYWMTTFESYLQGIIMSTCFEILSSMSLIFDDLEKCFESVFCVEYWKCTLFLKGIIGKFKLQVVTSLAKKSSNGVRILNF